MEYFKASILLTVISAKFEGGISEFHKSGGRIFVYSTDPFKCIIYYPEKEKMKECFSSKELEGVSIVSTLNFEGDVKKYENDILSFMETQRELVTQAEFNTLGCIFECQTTSGAKKLYKSLENLKGLLRAIIQHPKGEILYERNIDMEINDFIKEVVNNVREEVIKDDDILNLRISLETMSVDEFINSI